MMRAYYDIVPEADGWAYVHEGLRSVCYPSHALAAEAARRHAEEGARLRRPFVLRQQDLTGRFRETGPAWQGWAPRHASEAVG
ncbi:hypothetical protein ACSV9I_04860 [Rhizobium sp. G187]|uniref:hypothetical protein n=1 Tax=unclassified Rhizobium TaxID=2613769 RepID=UPI0006B8F20C|nr:hypothetical protein [Rhizobium sp. AAP43]KPF42084.1 hypothetical protein IP76_18455 [Rhizobium sp. AAP43]